MRILDTWKFALAAAITFALLNAVCAVALAIAPDATVAIFNTFMHGIDLAKLMPPGGRPVTFGRAVAGVAALAVISFVGGAILAGCYNLLIGWSSGQALSDTRERPA